MFKKEHIMWAGIGVLIGIALADRLRKLPVLSSIPSV